MHRFFVQRPHGNAGTVELTGQDAKHAVRVLRLAEGDSFIAVVDGDGQYLARIIEAEPRRVRAVLEGSISRLTEPRTKVTLFQGLPKGDKMDAIVQRCTEIGVQEIVPVISDRTVAYLDTERTPGRLERWHRIAVKAAELSGRTHVPKIRPAIKFSEALKMSSAFDLRLMPWEEERSRSIRQVLRESSAESVFLLIGAEGGFNAREADEALRAGVLPVTLGPRMMRTENAGAVALAIILYEFGDMG